MEDIELIRQYCNGQDDAGEILIDRYQNSLYKLCYNLSKNKYDADDLFQETWVKAVKNFKYYDGSRPFLPWLYTICTNLYKDKYRSKKRWLERIKDYFTNEEKDEEMERVSYGLPLPEGEVIIKYDRETLKKCIDMLNDIYKIPLILYYFKEINYNDISLILKIPIGTVKSRLNTGKRKLKELMEVYYERG